MDAVDAMDPHHLSTVVASAVSRAINDATRAQPPVSQSGAPGVPATQAPVPPAAHHSATR